jgi:hypothetical protein
MSLTGILLTLVIVAMCYGIFRAMRIRRAEVPAQSLGQRVSEHPSLHLLDEAQFEKLLASEPHHVLFHLQPIDRPSDESMGISVQELEKCLPWVPGETKVVIVSKAGFGPLLLDRLSSLPIKRDLFLAEAVQ